MTQLIYNRIQVTQRQYQVIQLAGKGLTHNQIAIVLKIKPKTVAAHFRDIGVLKKEIPYLLSLDIFDVSH